MCTCIDVVFLPQFGPNDLRREKGLLPRLCPCDSNLLFLTEPNLSLEGKLPCILRSYYHLLPILICVKMNAQIKPVLSRVKPILLAI